MPKRVFLFILVNILVVLTISISMFLLGIDSYLVSQGIDYQSLLIFCAVIGFAGSLISLASSRFMAKAMLGVQVIDPNNPDSSTETFLLRSVYRFAKEAGITTMPEVGIYESSEVNAFATGATKNSSLVAVSLGLLNQMDRQAIEGVLAHEVAHIANGDMVTMTLLQGIINTFVMFFARILAYILANAGRRQDDDSGPSYGLMYLLTFVFEIFLSILGSIVVCYFSRIREYAADRDGARLAGRDRMIHALRSLQRTVELIDHSHESLATFKISGRNSKFLQLFATHPRLEERIARLQSYNF